MIQVQVEGFFKGQAVVQSETLKEGRRKLQNQLSCSSESSVESPRAVVEKSSVLYVIHLANRQQSWSIASPFSEIRHFRNELLKLQTDHESCPFKTLEIQNVLEYGFPERKLFGSKNLKNIAERAYKIQNCLESVIPLHTKCQDASCSYFPVLDNFLQLSAHPAAGMPRLNVSPTDVSRSSCQKMKQRNSRPELEINF